MMLSDMTAVLSDRPTFSSTDSPTGTTSSPNKGADEASAANKKEAEALLIRALMTTDVRVFLALDSSSSPKQVKEKWSRLFSLFS